MRELAKTALMQFVYGFFLCLGAIFALEVGSRIVKRLFVFFAVLMLVGFLPRGGLADTRVCRVEKVIQKEICDEEKHPIAGAGLGWLILGPIGAIAGAVAGSNPDKVCHVVEEKTCLEYETRSEPSPVPKGKK